MTKQPQDFISVVVPTYHRNDLLRKCLSCLAPSNQLYPSELYEVVVSDDGSKTTAQQMMAEEFPWAKWVAGPRRGPAANRNHGASHARGEWLAFTDDDCQPKPQWLIAFSEHLDETIEVLEGKTTTEAENKGLFFTAPTNLTGGNLWSCNMLVSKTVFDRMEGFDNKLPFAYLEDVDFRMRLEKKGCTIQFVPDAEVFHPQRAVGSIFSQAREHESSFYMIQKHRMPPECFGLHPVRYLKNQLKFVMRESKSPIDAITFLFKRSCVEAILLCFLKPRWRVKYNLSQNPSRKLPLSSRRVLCINSTLGDRRSMVKDSWVSEFHNWGFIATEEDRLLYHRISRIPIKMRMLLGGIDFPVLFRVIFYLFMGYRSIYLVTQPDLLLALPLLKKLFPDVRIVIWVWTAQEAAAWKKQLVSCHHIFCLTEEGLKGVSSLGLGNRSSLQLLGASPQNYNNSSKEIHYDIAFLGISARDMAVIRPLLQKEQFHVVTTKKSIDSSNNPDLAQFMTIVDPPTHVEMIKLFQQSKASWIPLLPDSQTSSDYSKTAGYTNLLESLLSGVPVVMADSSILPEQILSLEGVFRYRAGDTDSFLAQTLAAIEKGSHLLERQRIRDAASEILNGVALCQAVEKYVRRGS